MHPIQTKAALTLAEPLQWRGGMLAFFAKDQAAPASVAAECSKNREIVLADVAGKAYHKCRRQRAVPFLERAARPSQMGGIAGRGTDFGSLAVRLMMDHCKACGLSFSLLFIDIVPAFHNLK